MKTGAAVMVVLGLLLAACGPSQESIQATVDAKIHAAIAAIPTVTPAPAATPQPTPSPQPALGQWVWGQNLALRVQRVMASPLVVYSRESRYWRLLPPEGKEFVMVWVDIFQNQAVPTQLNPSKRVELRDVQGTKYNPAHITGGEAIEYSPSDYYAPLFTEPVSLPPGNMISGWLAFLMPKGTSPQELVWDEIDRITVRLS